MKLIGTLGNKTLKVIPREFVNGTISVDLKNETTGVNVNITPTASTDQNYMSFTASFGTLVEGDFYNMTIKNGDNIIYKDKVFCTDQIIDQTNNSYYSVNSGEYNTENSFDNDYIIV
tara:strand:+ start:227 stop:577 length:351 start_codon:yes stop_codon:yes gene_type:complete